MSNLDKLYERSSAKWAHPEFEEAWELRDDGPSAHDTYLNTEKYTFEERKKMYQEIVDKNMAVLPELDVKTYIAKGCEEEPEAEVKMEILYPEKRSKKKLPCIYAIPSGGLCFCITRWIMNSIKDFANENGYAVVSVNYRTNFTGGGYPQTINDCHAGYKWLIENAAMLGINPDKIVFWGGSSGSHLALAVCHRLKKYNWYGYKARGCVVTATIADDRCHYPSNKIYINTGWNTVDNEATSRIWLGRRDYSRIPAEAFPNRATAEECIGLPPTFIHADELDPLSDSAAEYASKLVQAGVYTEYHRWGGGFHGMPTTLPPGYESDYANRFFHIFYGNLKDCIQYDLRRDWIQMEE